MTEIATTEIAAETLSAQDIAFIAAKPKATKTSVTHWVMIANPDKPMAEVVKLICEAWFAHGFGEPVERICENAYRIALRNGAPGVKPAKVAKVKAEKPAKVAKVKAPKADKAARAAALKAETAALKAAAKAAEPTKSPEEIERIKAANLARMKEVHAKVQKLEAQLEKPEVIAPVQPDSFEAPAFLTRRDVDFLV
jgi:hypothetical protein